MKKSTKKQGSGPSSRISDPRFASFETDPRFRLPSKKKTKTTIDKRFSRMLKDDDFTGSARVDRYGRKIKSDAKKKALQRLYQEDDEDEDEDDKDKKSSEEDEEEVEVDDDEIVQRELRRAHEKFDPARGGGFSSSESDSDSDSDEDGGEEEEEGEDAGVNLPSAGDMQKFQDEQADVEAGEVTNRIAIVNLDWDHVKSADLFALFSSFLHSDGGDIEKISVYPSEFGKERMQKEEVEGPPKALFKSSGRQNASDSDDSSDDGSEGGDEEIKKQLMQEGNDEDFDSDALRSYQLDRLRYYYAVMVCSSPNSAKKIYDATDGTEFQSSSNFLDLRFVPDDVTFDDEPRDECDRVPDSYKPVEFVTNALQSSKVKLTWDMHPEEMSRKESINRAFSGSRAELEENDLRAYLASDSEDDHNENDAGEDPAQDGEEGPTLSKKELARKKMREALGLADEPTSKDSKDGPVGDMQITFTPALTETKPEEDENKEETTIEKYKRKERERKEKKREKAKAKREGLEPDAVQEEEEEQGPAQEEEGEEELGFDDPFFTTDEPAAVSKSAIRKEERRKKREAREAAEAEATEHKAHLSKVMAEDANENQAEHLEHFDMNDIVKAEKKKGKKGKSKKNKGKAVDGKLQEDFKMDVDDDRFKAVFDSHEFAIDPSNPKFKATSGMKQLLEEGRKKRRGEDVEEDRMNKRAKKGGR